MSTDLDPILKADLYLILSDKGVYFCSVGKIGSNSEHSFGSNFAESAKLDPLLRSQGIIFWRVILSLITFHISFRVDFEHSPSHHGLYNLDDCRA